jgi:uridylate kinase
LWQVRYTVIMYKRILLKLSGEQLQGKNDNGLDIERLIWIANEVEKVKDTEIIVMIGAGNLVRGAQIAGKEISRVTADGMGMLGTMINALALTDVFSSQGVTARALSSIKADQILDQFTHRRALSHLAKGRVVIIAGGIGQPYLTTDTAAVALALQLECDAIFKATKVDGVYDADPTTNATAKKYDTIMLKDAVEQPDIRVMDKAAIALAADHQQPIVVFELLKEDNIARAIAGESVGTTIS